MQLSINERGTRWVKRARNTYFYKGLEAVVKGLIERGHAAIRGWPVIFGRNLGKKSPGMWRGTMPG